MGVIGCLFPSLGYTGKVSARGALVIPRPAILGNLTLLQLSHFFLSAVVIVCSYEDACECTPRDQHCLAVVLSRF